MGAQGRIEALERRPVLAESAHDHRVRASDVALFDGKQDRCAIGIERCIVQAVQVRDGRGTWELVRRARMGPGGVERLHEVAEDGAVVGMGRRWRIIVDQRS
jgi:hypothetical protein